MLADGNKSEAARLCNAVISSFAMQIAICIHLRLSCLSSLKRTKAFNAFTWFLTHPSFHSLLRICHDFSKNLHCLSICITYSIDLLINSQISHQIPSFRICKWSIPCFCFLLILFHWILLFLFENSNIHPHAFYLFVFWPQPHFLFLKRYHHYLFSTNHNLLQFLIKT